MSEIESFNIKQFAYDSKGNLRFSTFRSFIKKHDQKFIHTLTSIGLSLFFGIVFLLFSLLAIKMTMLLAFKVSYLVLSFSLMMAGFGYALHCFLEAYDLFRLKKSYQEEIPVNSQLFQSLLQEEKEKQHQELAAKNREIQKHQSYLEELKTYLIDQDSEQKIIQMNKSNN